MKKNNNKGFTFIELVLYMGILAVFMVAVTNLMGSVSASNRKMTTKEKVQTMASETYDSISDMLMSAVDVRVYGTAYISVVNSGVQSYKKVTGIFLIPGEDDTKDEGTGAVTLNNEIKQTINGVTVEYYDIADIKSFGDVTNPSTNVETYITADSDSAGLLYVYINYASGIDSNGDAIYTCCTLAYNDDDDKIYLCRKDSTANDYSDYIDKFVVGSDVLCKYVSNFDLQVNPDEDSFAITLDLKDEDTSSSYSVNGVVGLRNSYVLKAHSWN